MVQRAVNSSTFVSLILAAFTALLFSFSSKPGGDSFTIYQNDRLLLKQYVHTDASVKTISLLEDSGDDVLKMYYSHCGKIGTSRKISITGEGKKELVSWTYADSKGAEHEAMICKVKDIAVLQKKIGKGSFSIVYYSTEIPKGIALAKIAGREDALSVNR